MKVGIIGVGRLGLCLALSVEKENQVVGVDLRQDYIDSLNKKSIVTNEPGVKDALKCSKNVAFSTDVVAVRDCQLIFTTVQTPSKGDGSYDHTRIDQVVDSLLKFGEVEDKHFVINSTVMPGYSDTIAERMEPLGWTVSYNPEFIAQGNIMHDQAYPDVVLIGEGSRRAGDLIEELYRSFVRTAPEYCRMKRVEAELMKLSLNCFLTTKISYANMIGDICRKYGADPHVVLGAVGADSRVGKKYLKYGFGYGGPCFPRDNRALGVCGGRVGIDALISHATDQYNKDHLEYILADHEESGDAVVTLDGVAYKKGTDILEESQQLEYAKRLSEEGYVVVVIESKEVIELLKKEHPELRFIYEIREENDG